VTRRQGDRAAKCKTFHKLKKIITYFVKADVVPFLSTRTVLQILHFARHFSFSIVKSQNANLMTLGVEITQSSVEAIIIILLSRGPAYSLV